MATNNITRATIEQTLADTKAKMAKLPTGMDGEPDTERMTGGGIHLYYGLQAQIDMLEDLLGEPCRHHTKGKVTGEYWQCMDCHGLWDHFPQRREAVQFENFEEVAGNLMAKMLKANSNG